MRIGIPSGIGDASWIVSKLINASEWPEIQIDVADGWPYRLADFFKMLGKKVTYSNFNYNDILTFKQIYPYSTWAEISGSGFGRFFIEANSHLEQGKPLSEFLPDLETNYHYPLKIPSIEKKSYYRYLNDGKWIGISAASYRGQHAWDTWPKSSWKILVKMLIRDGYRICFLGGSWDDLTRQLASEMDSGSLDLVGRTTFGEACAVHKKLDFYIGFSSGLGIIRTVMELPTIMLFPEHLRALSRSWADPADLESKKYIPMDYTKPKSVYEAFKIQECLFAKEKG